MKELLSFIIKSIVKTPEKVSISEEEAEGLVKFTISLPKEDIGMVIGRQGKTIKAIKTLLSIQAKGRPFSIEIVEQEVD